MIICQQIFFSEALRGWSRDLRNIQFFGGCNFICFFISIYRSFRKKVTKLQHIFSIIFLDLTANLMSVWTHEHLFFLPV